MTAWGDITMKRGPEWDALVAERDRLRDALTNADDLVGRRPEKRDAMTDFERHDIGTAARLAAAEAREAWLAYIQATTTEEHFAAVDRLNAALAVSPEEAGLS